MKYSDKLRQHYIDDIESWRWDKLRRDAQLQRLDGCEEPQWVNYIGGVLNLYPSGKIYAPWTTNQTMRDVIRDDAFQEALDYVAESQGAWINHDSGDVFACWPDDDGLADYRDSDGKLESYAFPGGYQLYYIDASGNALCPECANLDYVDDYNSDDRPVAAAVNYEDPDLYCDHCGERIESAYADD
jgi:hypothetical protein